MALTGSRRCARSASRARISPRLRSPVSCDRTARSSTCCLCPPTQTSRSSSTCVQTSSSSIFSTHSPYAVYPLRRGPPAELTGLRDSRVRAGFLRRARRMRPYSASYFHGTPSGAHFQCRRQPVDTKLTQNHAYSAHYLRDRTSGDAWYDFIRFLAACRTQLPALTEVQVGTIVWPVVEYVCPLRAFRRLGCALTRRWTGRRRANRWASMSRGS